MAHNHHLTSKSIKNNTNIYNQRNWHQNHKRNNSTIAMWTATSQRPKLDLHHIHQCQHQEHTPTNGTSRRNQVPDPKHVLVDMSKVEREDMAVMVQFGESNGLFESQSNEAGKEEGAERVDVKGDKVLGNFRPGNAIRVGVKVDEAVVMVCWVPS
ncbi:unnamed protein product [Ilex paraguariensis]|uniref:Uncharacterized protein n=1 Tax=Ilex paraguariensis TaxID=185542 RepID=A0ABC8TQV9_9AQUA